MDIWSFISLQEGGEQLDVEYIEVSTYRRAPKVRVVQHYTPSYRWRPWNRYTYLYFYDGPIFYSSGYDSYLCWNYPIYDHHFLTIRTYYGGYLGRYRTYYPARYAYYHSPYYGGYEYGRVTPVYRKRTQLNRWSGKHETVRKQYTRSRLSTPHRTTQRTQTQSDVHAVIDNHRREAPPSTDRVSRSSIISQKQRATVARSTSRQTGAVRTYSSNRTPSSVQTTDRQRRLILNSRSNVSTSRNRTSTATNRSSQLQRRSTYSSSSRSSTSSSSRSSSDIDRTKQRNSTLTRSRSTQTRTPPTSTSRSSSSSSRSRSTASTRSSTSSSSDNDDDDDNNKTRSRTAERSKRRR